MGCIRMERQFDKVLIENAFASKKTRIIEQALKRILGII